MRTGCRRRDSADARPGDISGGGAKEAADKVFQFNGAGTLNVSSFAVQNFGTFVRSCGNCKTQYKRTINLNTVEATYKGSKRYLASKGSLKITGS